MSLEITLTDDIFDSTISSADKPILVDFWAPWCGPCRFIAPVLEELATEKADVLKIGKVNVDENPASAQKYGISAIPTMILFKDGKPVERLMGAMPKAMLEKSLEKHLG